VTASSQVLTSIYGHAPSIPVLMQSGPALIRQPPSVLAVAPAQLVYQWLQMGGGRIIGAHALLQPFADGVADRSARLVIDFVVLVVDSAVHASSNSCGPIEILQNQVLKPSFVSARRSIIRATEKIGPMPSDRFPRNRKKAPADGRG
jgi:hypothetical protein